MASTTRLLKNNFYSLQRQYGTPLEIFTEDEVTYDPMTGKKDIVKSRLYVRKALVWEFRGDLNFTYSIQYIRANSNFAQGGFYEQNDRLMAISNRDLRNFVVNRNSYCVYEQKRFNIVVMKALENEGALLLQTRLTTGQITNRQISLTLGDKAATIQEVGGTIGP